MTVCHTAMAATGARFDFERARRRHRASGAWRRLTARSLAPARPPDLGEVAALFWRPARLRSIPLEQIVGTVDATPDFDAEFRPTSERVSSRWQRVARARHEGRALPPIAVVERPDGYYVIDGRHRVSVARALGDDAIDAWARPAPPILPAPTPRTTTTEEIPMTHLTHRVVHAITRTLTGGGSAEERVHFHAGDDGRPYVCEDRRCSSPSLDPGAA
jgi:hypothetical protein